MKRIGILTMHYNSNYGAVLQAYALQNKVCTLGYDAELIHYVNPQGKSALQLLGGSLTDNLRALLRWRKRSSRIHAFKNFMDTYYHLSGEAIYDAGKLNENELDYDAYITGSDQTFNLKLGGDVEFRKNYFLPFVRDGRKLSYAASMGEKIKTLTAEEAEWMKAALVKYDALSVREAAAADFIESLGIKRPQIMLDPTMLLKSKDWDAVCCPTRYTPGSYILFYSVLSDAWVIEKVQEIAKKLGLPVIAPHYQNRFEMRASFVRADDIGPGEFISLIKNAAFVCTTSFHATVFSILYNKPFASFVLGEGNRLNHLLDLTNLKNRAVRQENSIDVSLFENYPDVDVYIEPYRNAAEKYLRESIEGTL